MRKKSEKDAVCAKGPNHSGRLESSSYNGIFHMSMFSDVPNLHNDNILWRTFSNTNNQKEVAASAQ